MPRIVEKHLQGVVMKSFRILSLVLALVLAAAIPAHAGGIYANEFGTPEMGTAGVGAEASALDASTAIPFYNPAGMTNLEGNQLIVGAGALLASVQFDLDPATNISGGNGGEAASPIPILTAGYVHSFTERFKFGVALFGAAGAAIEYDSDWAGRYQAQSSEILTLALSPTLAYRVNDWFSIGGGFNVMSSALETKVAVPRLVMPDGQVTIDGTDTAVSFNLSMMFEASEATRVGISYVSETEFDYAGDVTLSSVGLEAAVNTTLTLAQVVRVGVHHDFNDRTAIVGTLGWEDWSALENQFITVEAGRTATLPRNWEDTYRYGLGFIHRVGDAWRVRVGLNYDTSPTDAEDRTADLPVDRQLRLGAGFQNVRGEVFSWGAQLLYADLGDAAIDSTGPLNRRLVGSYSSNDYLGAAFNFQWRF
jgi:long-chain fatty acid transport protein